jgi:hypothetical protein
LGKRKACIPLRDEDSSAGKKIKEIISTGKPWFDKGTGIEEVVGH